MPRDWSRAPLSHMNLNFHQNHGEVNAMGRGKFSIDGGGEADGRPSAKMKHQIQVHFNFFFCRYGFRSHRQRVDNLHAPHFSFVHFASNTYGSHGVHYCVKYLISGESACWSLWMYCWLAGTRFNVTPYSTSSLGSSVLYILFFGPSKATFAGSLAPSTDYVRC